MTDTKLMQNRVLLGKIEASYGTDPVPGADADALLISNMQYNPLVGGSVERARGTGTLGSLAAIPINSHITFSFDMEIAGAGTAGLVPGYGLPLRAAAMSETVTQDTKGLWACP